jgi:hypothetical protein
MSDFPELLTYEEARDHILAIKGGDEFYVLQLLNKHARSGELRISARLLDFPRRAHESYQDMRQDIPDRQDIPTLYFEQLVSGVDLDGEPFSETRRTYVIAKDSLGECRVWRRHTDSLADIGWTSIRFYRDEIFKLWPESPQPEKAEPPIKDGRPGKMKLVMAEFHRRKTVNTLKRGVGEEARDLLDWAKDNCDSLPALQTIKNSIGPEFPSMLKVKKHRN